MQVGAAVGDAVGFCEGDDDGVEVGVVEGSNVGLIVVGFDGALYTTKQKTKTQHYNDLMMVVKLFSGKQ